MIVFIKHISIEGPGRIAEAFNLQGLETKTIDLYDGVGLPELNGVRFIVSLGGPMNVYETEKYPFLADEILFLQKAFKRGVPIVGICLGAQLLARALGAEVKKAETEEIGWSTVYTTEKARYDMLFEGIDDMFPVFQWHQDTFDLPDGAELLAYSKVCRNQAFRKGNAYGVQFHIEVGKSDVDRWLSEYIKDPQGYKEKKAALDSQFIDIFPWFDEKARKFCNNLLTLALEKDNSFLNK